MVFEPFFGSIAMVGKIVDMAEGMGMRSEMAIPKEVFSGKIEQMMVTGLSEKCINARESICYGLELYEAGYEGTAYIEGVIMTLLLLDVWLSAWVVFWSFPSNARVRLSALGRVGL